MSEFDRRVDPNLAAHTAVQDERSSQTVQTLADINFRLTSIDREIGGIHAELAAITMRTVLLANLSTAITSMVVSALTAYLIVSIA